MRVQEHKMPAILAYRTQTPSGKQCFGELPKEIIQVKLFFGYIPD